MQYTATGGGSRHFTITDEQGAPAGDLDYQWWPPNRARMTTVGGLVYDIGPSGFWQMTMAVTRNDIPFAKLRRTLGTGIEVRLATGAVYTFRRKNVWQGAYSLESQAHEELAAISGTFNWRKFVFDYYIETSGLTTDAEADMLLPILLFYCIRSLRGQYGGVF